MNDWRVNFGNGQVHDCPSKRACQDLIKAQFDGGGGCYIQRRGDSPSGWVRVKA